MEAKKLRMFKNDRLKKKKRGIDIYNKFPLNEDGGSNDLQVNSEVIVFAQYRHV